MVSIVYYSYHAPLSQVSDSSGFGSGGTSAPVAVLQSSDSSCYNLSKATSTQLWSFAFDTLSGPTQCRSMRIYWGPSTVNGCDSPLVSNRLPWSWTLTAFCHDIHCFAERSNFMALSQVVNPSLSLRVHFLVTLPARTCEPKLGLVSHGLPTFLVEPMFSSSGAMTEGWELAVALNVLF
jgi:hypothetical protein